MCNFYAIASNMEIESNAERMVKSDRIGTVEFRMLSSWLKRDKVKLKTKRSFCSLDRISMLHLVRRNFGHRI